MSRWFRHYGGMVRDEKLVRVAVKAQQPVERVVWVWGAILESASEINDGGRYEFDCGEAAYFLRCDEPCLASILASLEDFGRIAGGVVVRWGDRQYSSDSAAERQRRYRERKSGGDVSKRDDNRNRDATVTSRDGAVTAQETDTEADTERGSEAKASGASAPIPIDARTALFGDGLNSLARMTGKDASTLRSVVGKWVQLSGNDFAAVLAIIRAAEAQAVIDPIGWISKAMRPKDPDAEIYRNVL